MQDEVFIIRIEQLFGVIIIAYTWAYCWHCRKYQSQGRQGSQQQEARIQPCQVRPELHR